MLSRFAYIRNQGVAKCVIPISQRITTVHTSAPLNEESNSRREFPAATSKRDFVNYPSMIMRKERPPVRLGVIPESWFKFFYPKTGYTGPYAFIVTVGTYLLSKEKIVVDEAFSQTLSFVVLFFMLNKYLGHHIRGFFEKIQKDQYDNIEAFQNEDKIQALENIKVLEGNEKIKTAIAEATTAKKELVLLQMEIAYRERIAEIYEKIKKRLDCLVALEAVDRRSAHKNLVDYVLRGVDKGLTPELEKNVMQNCISQLNALATKA